MQQLLQILEFYALDPMVIEACGEGLLASLLLPLPSQGDQRRVGGRSDSVQLVGGIEVPSEANR